MSATGDMHDRIERDLQAEIERLNEQVALMREALTTLVGSNYDAGFQLAEDALSATKSDWIANKLSEARDSALEEVADAFSYDRQAENIVRAMKGTQ